MPVNRFPRDWINFSWGGMQAGKTFGFASRITSISPTKNSTPCGVDSQ